MLQTAAVAGGESPSVMVRERFPEVPRARVKIAAGEGPRRDHARGHGLRALPLTRADGQALAAATPARRAADQRAVAELLGKISACASDEETSFELEIFVGAEPACLAAAGEIKRR